jgi:hypothetical protein
VKRSACLALLSTSRSAFRSLPGKVDYQQAKKFAEAFLRGQPRRATIATTLLMDKIEQLKA